MKFPIANPPIVQLPVPDSRLPTPDSRLPIPGSQPRLHPELAEDLRARRIRLLQSQLRFFHHDLLFRQRLIALLEAELAELLAASDRSQGSEPLPPATYHSGFRSPVDSTGVRTPDLKPSSLLTAALVSLGVSLAALAALIASWR